MGSVSLFVGWGGSALSDGEVAYFLQQRAEVAGKVCALAPSVFVPTGRAYPAVGSVC